MLRRLFRFTTQREGENRLIIQSYKGETDLTVIIIIM